MDAAELQRYLPQVPPQIDAATLSAIFWTRMADLPAQSLVSKDAFIEGEGPRWAVAKIRDFVATKRLQGINLTMYEGRGWLRRAFAVRGDRPSVEAISRFIAMSNSPDIPSLPA